MDEKEVYKMCGFREDYDPNDRIIGGDTVEFQNKKYYVSTVDLGLNHRFGEGEPLYWETMIFKQNEDGTMNWHDFYCDRYSSKEDAEKNHKEIVQAFKDGKAKLNEDYFEIEGISHENN